MPSGYTSDIYEGKDVTAKEFILKCARAFGATIMMRDEPMDKEIPEFEPSDYHIKALEREKENLEKYKNMTLTELQKEIDESFEKGVESYHKRKKEYDELEARYTKVLTEVKKWTPPTEDHTKLKEYAMDQLYDSISFDCNQSYLKYPKKTEASKWLEMMISKCEDGIKYHQKEWDAEVKRTNERNKWVKELKDSFL